MSHDQVRAHLAPAHHEAYDRASGAYEARMTRGTGAANRAGAQMAAGNGATNAAFTRPSYWDPAERLRDMDADGVDVEVLYSEVSAFRYLSNVDGAVSEAVRAFNDALCDFASTDPKRLIVSYQVPIHDIAVAVAEVERIVAFGGKSLQLPVFPNELGLPDYYD